MQCQCWICPHCYDDRHHKSNESGCEWQGLSNSEIEELEAERIRKIKEEENGNR